MESSQDESRPLQRITWGPITIDLFKKSLFVENYSAFLRFKNKNDHGERSHYFSREVYFDVLSGQPIWQSDIQNTKEKVFLSVLNRSITEDPTFFESINRYLPFLDFVDYQKKICRQKGTRDSARDAKIHSETAQLMPLSISDKEISSYVSKETYENNHRFLTGNDSEKITEYFMHRCPTREDQKKLESLQYYNTFRFRKIRPQLSLPAQKQIRKKTPIESTTKNIVTVLKENCPQTRRQLSSKRAPKRWKTFMDDRKNKDAAQAVSNIKLIPVSELVLPQRELFVPILGDRSRPSSELSGGVLDSQEKNPSDSPSSFNFDSDALAELAEPTDFDAASSGEESDEMIKFFNNSP